VISSPAIRYSLFAIRSGWWTPLPAFAKRPAARRNRQ
jgi:hypothetical protein